MNSLSSASNFSPRLIEGSFKRTVYGHANHYTTSVSQKVQIGNKKYEIRLHFKGNVSEAKAKTSMERNLIKASSYAIAFQLGEENIQNHETTQSLKLDKHETLERTYTDKKGLHLETFKKDAALDQVTEKLKNMRSPALAVFSQMSRGEKSLQAAEKIKEPESIEVIESGQASPPPSPTEASKTDTFPPYNKSILNKPILHAPAIGLEGSYLEALFKDQSGVPVAKETATRVQTVRLMIRGLESKAAAMQKKIDLMKPSHPAFKQINDLLNDTKEQIARYEKNWEGATWGSTNSLTRFGFMALGRERAKAEYAPILCNLHMQTVYATDKNGIPIQAAPLSIMSRSAAITDFSHGEISLQELEDYEAFREIAEGDKNIHALKKSYGFKSQEPKIASAEGDKNRQALKEFYGIKSLEPKFAVKEHRKLKLRALIGYGTSSLVKEPTKELNVLIEKLIKNNWIIKRNAVIKRAKLTKEEKKLLDNTDLDPQKLDKIISKRTDILSQQALQDIYTHFKSRKVSEDETVYARTSLLNVEKSGKNEHGCILHERTLALDMKALFDGLDNKLIHFDVPTTGGPYIDEKGEIHMPVDCAEGNRKTTQLKTVLFNISPQRHTKNEGLQKTINDEALKKLKELHERSKTPSEDFDLNFKNLEEGLLELTTSNKSDPFDTVLSATHCLGNIGAYKSANCLGGKDRTGYDIALVTHSVLCEFGGNDESLMRRWGHELLSKEGIAVKIAYFNADQTALKLERYDLKLYDTKSVEGKMLRTADGVIAAARGVKSIFGHTPSETPGQLYKSQADRVHGG